MLFNKLYLCKRVTAKKKNNSDADLVTDCVYINLLIFVKATQKYVAKKM